MVSKKSFLILFIFLIVIIFGFVFSYISTRKEIASLSENGNNLVKEKEEISAPPATGNIDDTVNSLLKELDDEDFALKGLDGDLILIDDDSQEVDDFGQSINEDDF